MFLLLMGSCSIWWPSKQQPKEAKSSDEADNIVLSGAADECMWLRRLLIKIGFQPKSPSGLFEDNRGVTDLSKNLKFHAHT